jgi:hypothetical protein
MSVIAKILEKRMTQKDIKMGVGIANDKRYAGGNMTGATKAMDKLKPGLSDHPAIQKALRKANEETEQDSDDYKLDKRGHKHKAHKIIFNKGEEENMKEEKKSYKSFIEQHTLSLTEEQLDEIVSELQEVLGKDAKAGDWISDFVKSDNPKFEGKSKEKRKEMALAAYYAKQRNEEVDMDEELKGNQHKLDKNKNGKLDKHDFKLLRKEDTVDESESHQSKTTMKHVANATPGEKKAAKDIKPGIKGFADRIAMLKSAQARGALKKEEVDESAVPEHMKGKQKPYVSSDGKGGHEVLGNTGQVKATFTQKEHGKEAKAKAIAHLQKNYDAYMKEEIDEALWPGTPEYKKKFDTDRVTGAGARHDIKKTSTGVIATRRFADNDTAEKPKDEPKRGRGRPKKDKFAEAVEFLIGLDEETFDSLMEEGFDSFMEQFEQLDEISKSTLGSYVKKASRDAVVTRKIGADFENMADKSRKPSSKAAATELADKWKSKSFKRSANINKAVDRLTK